MADSLAPRLDAPKPNYDAFWADDPPISGYCGPDGGWTPPPLPGGTPECPDDKNREGCPCSKVDQSAPCWPGKRANRNRGICTDGVTVCQRHAEMQGRWGPCLDYVLPTEGVTLGREACGCFSAGQWVLDNLVPCFMEFATPDDVYAVSTYIDSATGKPTCPPYYSPTPPPQPKPGTDWSDNRLTVDCAGFFKICFTLKAGEMDSPDPADCVVAATCTEAWYPEANVVQELPPLPAWVSSDRACSVQFDQTGGYAEMSVEGTSIECQDIGVEGQPRVFNRVKYCPTRCSENPTMPGCEDCKSGAGGEF